MVSERCQSQNTTYCMIPFNEICRIAKSIEAECRLDYLRPRGLVEWGMTANEHGLYLGVMKCSQLDCGDSCKTL